MADAKRDENRVPTLLAVSSSDGTTPVTLYADPTTHRLYVDLPGGGAGTVTTVSVVTANGISGTVANATTTPAITLTLGAITPSSVNGVVVSGTSTPTLAVTGTTAVSGTNTGDNATNTQYSGLAASKQDALVSGTNIKTINSTSLLGSGDIAVATSTQGTTADNALPKAGGTMTGDITLGENTSIALDPAGSADGKYTGITVTGVAGETVAFGDLMYLKAADSRWWLTDADASATGGPVMVGMCVVGGAAAASIKILLQGIIRADSKFPALTIGAPAYLGETAGAIQTAIPTGADNVIRVVGFAMTADELYFNPSQDHQITVA